MRGSLIFRVRTEPTAECLELPTIIKVVTTRRVWSETAFWFSHFLSTEPSDHSSIYIKILNCFSDWCFLLGVHFFFSLISSLVVTSRYCLDIGSKVSEQTHNIFVLQCLHRRWPMIFRKDSYWVIFLQNCSWSIQCTGSMTNAGDISFLNWWHKSSSKSRKRTSCVKRLGNILCWG